MSWCCYGRNVTLIITAISIDALAQGVWAGPVLAAYLYAIFGTNTTVGMFEAIYGVAQLISALPTGWIADEYRKDAVVRVSVYGAIAASSSSFAWSRCVAPVPFDELFSAQAGSGIILIAVVTTTFAFRDSTQGASWLLRQKRRPRALC